MLETRIGAALIIFRGKRGVSDLMEKRIYDCFIFFNELELLELRLRELQSCVDFFVICEAPVTFRGKQKPLYYLENQSRFLEFKEKIIHG